MDRSSCRTRTTERFAPEMQRVFKELHNMHTNILTVDYKIWTFFGMFLKIIKLNFHCVVMLSYLYKKMFLKTRNFAEEFSSGVLSIISTTTCE